MGEAKSIGRLVYHTDVIFGKCIQDNYLFLLPPPDTDKSGHWEVVVKLYGVPLSQMQKQATWHPPNEGTRCVPWRAERVCVALGRRRGGRRSVVAWGADRTRAGGGYANPSDAPSSHLRECCAASTERAMVWRSGADAGRPEHTRLL